MSSVVAELERVLARQRGTDQALEASGQTLSWNQLRARVLQVRTLACEVRPHGRIATPLRNDPDGVAALLGIMLARRGLVLTGAHAPSPPDVDAALLLGPAEARLEVGNSPANPQPTFLEPLTSGSTGRPMRVSLTEAQVGAALAGARSRGGSSGSRPGTSLITHPIDHIAGLWALLGAMTEGRPVALLNRFTADAWVDAVERHQIRATFLVPTALRMLLDTAIPRERVASLALISTGAAPCPVETIESFRVRHGIPVLTTYGATEFCGAVAGWNRELFAAWWPAKAGSAGRAHPKVSLRIEAPDERGFGTLMVRGAQTRWAWWRTRDRARIDADGFLWLDGRLDDVIVRGGFKVHPSAVTRGLAQHPDVREAAVFGVPDPRLGAVPVALVEPVPGRMPSPDALMAHCRGVLAPYECPARIMVGALPRTESGKIRRQDLERVLADA